MLLQIHDELVFEVSPDSVNDLAHLVREEMTQVLPLRVPLKVDLIAFKAFAFAADEVIERNFVERRG